ncbi:hypothetical protein NKR17_05635 [Priestia flexa]|uniref:hypothetical protein n=1 Tax=Priestia flexa TaxID=86664 RepID=UPI00203E2460|nr:hypothetical protein [Priestia flexa]MCM3068412.1 hypothetical protein [Priestia flexa]MCP1188562.1 hypothetical protein [Priestia flexa]
MNKLRELQYKIENEGKDRKISEQLKQVLEDENNINLKIDLIGQTHVSNWLPKKKKVLWDSFDEFNNEVWINSCLDRILKDKFDDFAIFSLLNCDTKKVLEKLKQFNYQIVLVWDTTGAETQGLGLARIKNDIYHDYFYIGWDTNKTVISRVEYIEEIKFKNSPATMRLDLIDDECDVKNWIWSELPYGYERIESCEEYFFNEDIISYNPSPNVRNLLDLFD